MRKGEQRRKNVEQWLAHAKRRADRLYVPLRSKLRIQAYETELKLLDLVDASTARTLMTIVWMSVEAQIVEAQLKFLDTRIGELGAELGLGVDTPCEFVPTSKERKALRAARLGDRPKGAHLCHRCDKTKCVADGHMFWGTPSDNMLDMVLKGRSKAGDEDARTRWTRRLEKLRQQMSEATAQLGPRMVTLISDPLQ